MHNLANILADLGYKPSITSVVVEVEYSTGYCQEDTTELDHLPVEDVELHPDHGSDVITVSPSGAVYLQETANGHAESYGHYVGSPDEDEEDGEEYEGGDWHAKLYTNSEKPDVVGDSLWHTLKFLSKDQSGLACDLWLVLGTEIVE
ncbi:hypothetical protein [Vibrio phage JSF12]|uniref:Uncharacterized protein n=2 Tax=Jesfedecavirus TaxID=2560156 RepID=A0A2D0Z8L8_9CAUD|nr:hypothetical protein FDI98_gp044 [Vibrio phage JSF10]YP_009794775.1 hypothetical protein HOS35_gp092 [Vibrio phage JSF12]ASV43488.1 hypothetical protein [Vibrio phage JSF10]ASV43610.1 hypothetical protein [Vibrio phage JSF12]